MKEDLDKVTRIVFKGTERGLILMKSHSDVSCLADLKKSLTRYMSVKIIMPKKCLSLRLNEFTDDKRQEAVMRFARVVRFAVENDVQFLASRMMLQVESEEYECMYEAVVAELLQSRETNVLTVKQIRAAVKHLRKFKAKDQAMYMVIRHPRESRDFLK